MDFDAAATKFDEILEEAGPLRGRNEAQTRLDIIDQVVRGALGWEHNEIHVETRSGDRWIDYELGDPGAQLIIEAKREGVAFELPVALSSGVHALDPLLRDKSNRALRKAMEQVMSYCSERGVAPAVVTNGRQWIAFLASRTDGVAPLSGKALVFASLEDIRADFLTFWNNLSADATYSHKLFATLSVADAAPPRPLSAMLNSYPGTKQRNPLQANLQVLGQLMLEDMPSQEEYRDAFLSECYATSGALTNYAEVSRELLANRARLLATADGPKAEAVATRRGINPALAEDSVSAALSHRPIILLGNVGAGKSTFIQHLVHVDARAVFENALAFVVDFGFNATFTSPTDFAMVEIERQLREDHGIDVEELHFVEDVYRKDLDRFDKGVFGQLREADPRAYVAKRSDFLAGLIADRPSHVKRSLERVARSRRKQVVIFLDNVDQRSRDDQNAVFLASNEIAANWTATVFVTLRPETFHESERYGAVSGYHPRVFTIAPPRTDVMLKKRIEFAIKVLESGGDAAGSPGSFNLRSDNLLAFLRVLDQNVSHNRPLMAMIDSLAGGNMRLALDSVTEFIGSGHVDTEKIITIQNEGVDGYTIPQHEFLRSLLHGDGVYYDPQRSPVPNVFQIDRPQPRSHFLIMMLLDYVGRMGEARDVAGYVGVDSVVPYFQGFGFPVASVLFALDYARRFRLVESPDAAEGIEKATRVRITTVGAYSLGRLPRMFTYVDAVLVDTPVLDSQVSGQLRDEHQLAGRLARARIFKGYLDSCWARSGVPDDAWDWAPFSRSLGEDIAGVERRLARTRPD